MRTGNTPSTAAILILFASFLSTRNNCEAVKCYKCTILPPPAYSNETARLCSFFDYSDKFIVDCPYSTFCMKRAFTVYLSSAINGTLRDCAPQKSDYQVYKDNKWQVEFSVEEPYEEGCIKVDDKGQRISRPIHCYCKGDLCNGTGSFRSNTLSIKCILAVICAIFSINNLWITK